MIQERFSLMTFRLDVDVLLGWITAEECLLLAKQAGIPYVDVMNPSQRRVAEYVRGGERTDVRTHCYIGSVSFFSNRENSIRRLLLRHLRSAEALGAKLFMIVPVNAQIDELICRKLGKAEARKRLEKYFSLAVDLARGRNIRVCFETTPQDYTCLSGAEDCRWILERLPELGLVYDTANMLSHGDDPLEYYEALKNHIVYVHLKDVTLVKAGLLDCILGAERTKDGCVMKCCVSGQGVIPLAEILNRMERDGYKGKYALEYSHPDNYPAGYSQNACYLAKHMDFWENLAVHGRDIIA